MLALRGLDARPFGCSAWQSTALVCHARLNHITELKAEGDFVPLTVMSGIRCVLQFIPCRQLELNMDLCVDGLVMLMVVFGVQTLCSD